MNPYLKIAIVSFLLSLSLSVTVLMLRSEARNED